MLRLTLSLLVLLASAGCAEGRPHPGKRSSSFLQKSALVDEEHAAGTVAEGIKSWFEALLQEKGTGKAKGHGVVKEAATPKGTTITYREPAVLQLAVVRQLPHKSAVREARPFMQGLQYMPDGNIIETSGTPFDDSKSFSYLSVVDPKNGTVLRTVTEGLEGTFVEGLARMPSGHWFASTFHNNKVVEYDESLNFVQSHPFPQTGWGLAPHPDGIHFLATSGSTQLKTLDPKTFETVSSKPVTCLGKLVDGLNELELVPRFQDREKPTLLGNLFRGRLVLALDPETAECTHVFQLPDEVVLPESKASWGKNVPNGIAYNPEKNTFLVGGKRWGSFFEVELSHNPKGSMSALQMLKQHVGYTGGRVYG